MTRSSNGAMKAESQQLSQKHVVIVVVAAVIAVVAVVVVIMNYCSYQSIDCCSQWH